jgi:hypothetical protein
MANGVRFQWTFDDFQLSGNYELLDPSSPIGALAAILEGSGEGWIYLVVPRGAATYSVMAVNTALLEALDRWPPEMRDRPVGALPWPSPVGSIEEGMVPWNVARERVLDAPARSLPVSKGGEVVGILADPARRVPRVEEWLDAFSGEPPPWSEPLEKAVGEREVTRGTLSPSEEQLEEPVPPPRFVNAGFFPETGLTPLPVDQPLALDGGPYRLGVNVGKFWGPGERPEDKFALDGILKDALEALEEEEALTLVVAVRPRSIGSNLVQVDQPRRELSVPKAGDGPLVFFDLTFNHRGRYAINVDLFYQGHLLQSRRVEAWVVQQAGDPVPADRPAQDGRLTFSRSGTLGKDRLAALEKRPSTLTITVERQGGQIGLWFYDVEGRALGTQQPNLSDAILHTLLERMRGALQQVTSDYRGDIGGSWDKLSLSLWRLASIGSEFYRALLPRVFDPGAPGPAGQIVDLKLIPGQVIQVAPLSMLPGVPWELLYERRIEHFRDDRPDRVALCPDFLTHEPDACPHDGTRVVCPHSFWGYRYIIEQLPNWVAPDQPPPLADLPLLVRNRLPLKFVPLVYGWDNLESHLDALRALAAALDMEPEVKTLDGVEEVLKDQHQPADILYFYAHGGFDDHEPMLELGLEGAEFKFTAGDLAAWRDEIDLSLRQPLVVFNACETAAFLPEHHESLPKGFADRGASGVIGTQVQVPTTLADHFIRIFFQNFLAKQTVGQSLFEARRALLFNSVEGPGGKEYRPDPRGLVYSMFAAADIELAQPVITSE